MASPHHCLALFLLAACLASGSAYADADHRSPSFPPGLACEQLEPHDEDRCRLKGQLSELRQIQSEVEDDVLAVPGVLGFGIGRAGADLVFSVLVDRSERVHGLPRRIRGIPVRIEPRDPVQTLNGYPACGDTSPCHADQQALPVEMGNSGGWNSQTGSGACSLGFKACDLGTGKVVFVTNSHCNQSGSTCALANPGAATAFWMHPGRMDAENPTNCFSAGTCSAIGDITAHAAPACASNNNFTDATKVESSSELTSSAFRDIGFPMAGAGDPLPGDLVRKSGRTTGDTAGQISAVNVTVNVPAPAPGINGFCCGALQMKDQIEWSPIDSVTKPGDSGSALLSLEPELEFQVVGLNWGSDGTFSYANHIDRVLSALNLSLNFVSCFRDCVFTAAADVASRQLRASSLLDDRVAAASLIDLGHRARDQVLVESRIGRKLTALYYQFSDEALRLAEQEPRLLLHTARLLAHFKPALVELVTDGNTHLSDGEWESIDGLLATYARQPDASDAIRVAIGDVRRQLADEDVRLTLGLAGQVYGRGERDGGVGNKGECVRQQVN